MYLLELAFNLIITIIVYLSYPLGYRYVNGKVSRSKGNKIALWNSVVCATIFCIIRSIIYGQIIIADFAPAIFYYFIAKLILIDKSLPEHENRINDIIKNPKRVKPANPEKIDAFYYATEADDCLTEDIIEKEKTNGCKNEDINRVDDMPILNEETDNSTIPVDEINNKNTSNNLKNELLQLKELLDEGLITQEDYDTKKKILLGL